MATPSALLAPDILSKYNRCQVVVSNIIQENQVMDNKQKGNLHADE